MTRDKRKKFSQEIYVLTFDHFSCGAIAPGAVLHTLTAVAQQV
ncbi:MAG: hypothetical protein V7K24_11145 [Nostoc sp.]